MKKLLYTIFALCVVACGSKSQTTEISNISPKDSLLVAEFYKPYIQSKFGNDSIAIQQFIWQKTESLDSCYLIHYKQPINGYDIRMTVDSVEETVNDIICNGSIIVSNGDKAICIDQFPICLSDSLLNGLLKCQINEVEYTIKKHPYQENLKYPHFGEYKDTPFLFFDTDFDGENELVIRNVGVGQRSLNCYYPIKLNWNTCEWNIADDMICGNGDIMTDAHFYPFDDMTQFDYAHKTFILYLSAGWWDNEWHYYKVDNGERKLIKKIVEYDRNAPKVKRITYHGNDSTITNISVSKDNSYSID